MASSTLSVHQFYILLTTLWRRLQLSQEGNTNVCEFRDYGMWQFVHATFLRLCCNFLTSENCRIWSELVIIVRRSVWHCWQLCSVSLLYIFINVVSSNTDLWFTRPGKSMLNTLAFVWWLKLSSTGHSLVSTRVMWALASACCEYYEVQNPSSRPTLTGRFLAFLNGRK